MASLHIRGIPEDLKKRFQAICKERGRTMSQALIDSIKQTVGEEIARIAAAKFTRRRRFRK